MKEYNSVLLEDEEAQTLLEIAHLNNIVIKPIPFKGDIDDSLEEFDYTEYAVFYYMDNHVIGLYFYNRDLIKFSENLGFLKNLRFLLIIECLIKEFPACFKELHNLEYLIFINNPETSTLVNLDLPDGFYKFKKLKKLHIDGLFNVFLPPSFSELENLEVLQLKYCFFTPNRSNFLINYDIDEPSLIVNYIHELPEDLRKFKSLKKLVLSDLEIEKVPKSLLDLTTLLEIDLSYSNQIMQRELKEINVIFKLKTLETLNLSYCQLEYIPKTIETLTKLKDLDLSWNFLKEIPDEIKNCHQLEKISLYCNDFNKNFNTWIKSLVSLKKLKLLTIDENCYKQLPNELIEKQDLIIKKI